MLPLPILEVHDLSKWYSMSTPVAKRRLGDAVADRVNRFLARISHQVSSRDGGDGRLVGRAEGRAGEAYLNGALSPGGSSLARSGSARRPDPSPQQKAGEKCGLDRPAWPADLPDPQSGFWALKDISFALQPGERIGFIGRNGSGKSTLLKLLARITAPSGGTATLRGRVSALLEVGAGLHPDISGRQNIFLYGTMMGMPRREIEENLDAIIDFSELSRFIHMPVKHYSSGMYLRLAFSVAAHLNPEILLMDEILAVGDEEFQRKCRARLDVMTARGVTLAVVSHDLEVVARLCHRVIWLEGGRIRANGLPRDVIAAYKASFLDSAAPRSPLQNETTLLQHSL